MVPHGEIFVLSDMNNIISNETVLKNLKDDINNEKIKYEEKRKDVEVPNKSFEDMSIEELQQVILNKMAKNGPVTDEMKRTVYENVYKNSLINWVNSFR